MTLVVARVGRSGPRLVGDLRVTDPGAVRRGYLEGALKAVLVHPNLCVSFAGTVNVGLDAVRELRVDPHVGFDLRSVQHELLVRHRRTQQAAEFLIAVADPPSLSRVRNGFVESGLSEGWIGDPTAFAAYRRHAAAARQLGAAGADDEDLAGIGMLQGMRHVLEDDSVPSVGEAYISVIPTAGGFMYAEAAEMVGGRSQPIPSGTWTTVQFGGAAEGGFAYSVLPRAPGIGAIGIHFYQGNIGVLYYPARFDKAQPFANVSHDDFRRRVEELHGFEIQGPSVS